jgi:GT2 family glycosyltransferase
MNNELSIVMVSFFSEKVIQKALKHIPRKYKIFITDNAITTNLKNILKKKFKNVEVLNPKSNLGNGAGINFALKKTKSKYVLYLDVDTVLEKNTINELLIAAKKNKNWSIIAPNIKKYYYKKNDYIDNYQGGEISYMKFVEGCALFFNMKVMKKIGFFDEKIFLYYEENDLFMRCLNNNKKIILLNSVYIRHIGNSSVDKSYEFQIELNRNWHYMWSKFYFLRKHYSLLKAYKDTLGHFLKALLKFAIYIFFNKKKSLIYKYRMMGLLNSYCSKTSWMRPNTKLSVNNYN